VLTNVMMASAAILSVLRICATMPAESFGRVTKTNKSIAIPAQVRIFLAFMMINPVRLTAPQSAPAFTVVPQSAPVRESCTALGSAFSYRHTVEATLRSDDGRRFPTNSMHWWDHA
jgi:hypothetical protein